MKTKIKIVIVMICLLVSVAVVFAVANPYKNVELSAEYLEASEKNLKWQNGKIALLDTSDCVFEHKNGRRYVAGVYQMSSENDYVVCCDLFSKASEAFCWDTRLYESQEYQ